MADHNSRPAEDAFDQSLSSRLPRNSSTLFRFEDGAILDITADVGPLMGVLPLEMIHAVLQQLDLASLARLGDCVSTGMRRAVTSLPQLRAVEACARDAIRAIRAARIGHLVRCDEMYAELRRPTCAQCKFQPGHYLYLLSCQRVCKACLVGRTRFQPLRPAQVAKEFGMRSQDVRRLPRLRVPKYSPRARALRCGGGRAWRAASAGRAKQRNTTGWLLIDREVALRASLQLKYDTGAIDRPTWERRTSREVAKLHRKWTALTQAASSTLTPERAYSAAVLFPWFDRSTRNVGRPVLCRACRFGNAPASQWYYCQTGEKDHLDHYGPIVNGAHVKPSISKPSAQKSDPSAQKRKSSGWKNKK
ncbi:Cyclin-like F-box [Akanthomyces lecanii RCEF 1005]|uniref:Cyclin-like F-box n=1 Tax=Akanthomyces lecanii RCEF 1005 TaxID=1081108 RepID=A0A168G4T6_CORDF|nr:Cyclin-like F-box [Akanthomyces lecanii RCEF 1005]